MPIRPQIDDETAKRVDEKLNPVMRVDPKNIGLDKKINVLLDELEKVERQQKIGSTQQQSNTHGLR